jgi:hypothetical protein
LQKLSHTRLIQSIDGLHPPMRGQVVAQEKQDLGRMIPQLSGHVGDEVLFGLVGVETLGINGRVNTQNFVLYAREGYRDTPCGVI